MIDGGPDVGLVLYRAVPDPRIGEPRIDRDGWEHALLAVALERDLPVLAVRWLQPGRCGHGRHSPDQHVPDVVGHEGHRPVPGTYGSTHVKVTPGTRLASIIGDDADVPCHHHQSIAVVADGLEVSALADDGVIEAIEAPDRRFLVGVQWHPEDGSDARLFAALVEAARA